MNYKSKTALATPQDLRAATDERWAAFARTGAAAGVWMIELLVAQAVVHWQGQSMATVFALLVGVAMGLGMAIRACWEGLECITMEQTLRQRDAD